MPTSHQSSGFDPSILRHSGIWGAADKAVLNNVLKKRKIQISRLVSASKREGESKRENIRAIMTCLMLGGLKLELNIFIKFRR
jgi:hypothetical protein